MFGTKLTPPQPEYLNTFQAYRSGFKLRRVSRGRSNRRHIVSIASQPPFQLILARAAVFWDLDNIKPSKADCISRLRTCLQAATAEAASKHWKAEVTSEHVEVHVYCNTDTAKAYRSQLDVLVRQPNVQLHVKRVWRQSVDQAIVADMVKLAVREGTMKTITLVSCDQGYAKSLAYCRSRCCFIISISRILTHRPITPRGLLGRESGHLRKRWSLQPLICASDLAFSWDDVTGSDADAVDIT